MSPHHVLQVRLVRTEHRARLQPAEPDAGVTVAHRGLGLGGQRLCDLRRRHRIERLRSRVVEDDQTAVPKTNGGIGPILAHPGQQGRSLCVADAQQHDAVTRVETGAGEGGRHFAGVLGAGDERAAVPGGTAHRVIGHRVAGTDRRAPGHRARLSPAIAAPVFRRCRRSRPHRRVPSVGSGRTADALQDIGGSAHLHISTPITGARRMCLHAPSHSILLSCAAVQERLTASTPLMPSTIHAGRDSAPLSVVGGPGKTAREVPPGVPPRRHSAPVTSFDRGRGRERWGVVNLGRAERSAQLFGLLAMIVHRTSQDATAILRREGLNPAQFQLLLAVKNRPGATQREIGDQFGVTGGNVSMLVSKLTAAGWLRREPKGAAYRIWLTEDGAALVARLEPDQSTFMERRFTGLTDDELDDLLRLAQLALEGLPRLS